MSPSTSPALATLVGRVFAAVGAWVVIAGAVPAEPGRAGPVRLVAVGDLMLGTSQADVIRKLGPEHPFRVFRDLLRSADVAFGNLETPISDRGTPTPGKSPESIRAGRNYLFRAPPAAARGLAWAGFDIVSLANNHAMDYGSIGLRDTLRHLERERVSAVGAGQNEREAFGTVILRRGGERLGFLAISDVIPAQSAAGPRTPGLAPARGPAFERLAPAAIRRLRRDADRVLVSVHWGKERHAGATPRQRALGRRLIQWGADVVIGHHTHVLGPIERYRDGLIHYSLGNFIGYPQARHDVGAWEITFPPGGRPQARMRYFRWDGRQARR